MSGWIRGSVFIMVGLLMAACGGNNAASSPTQAVVSTIAIPTFSFSQPTDPPQVITAAATLVSAAATAETVLNAEAVARGRDRYVALDCATCHGENGEGTDVAITLKVYTGSEEQFVTFMRSGGTLGTSHQYATNRLSATGATNLYQYLLSLRGE